MARARSALMRRGRSVHDADDLVQDAWVRLSRYEASHSVEQPEAFLMQTALNLSIDAHRRQVNRGEAVVLEEVVLIDTAPSAEAVLLGRERLARVSQGLQRLPDKTREIFLDHRLEGLTYEEIGRKHKLALSSVERHIAKATLLLTAWMDGC